MTSEVFPARLAGAIRWISIGGVGVLLVAIVLVWRWRDTVLPWPLPLPWWWFAAGGPTLVLFVATLQHVRGYALESDGLYVLRPLWRKRIALRIDSAQADDHAFDGAWRLFANGGLLGLTGSFRSRRLGNFRAWVTDLRTLVVLRHAGGCAVISPQDRARFLAVLGGRRA